MSSNSLLDQLSYSSLMLGFNCMIFIVLQNYPFFYETVIGLDIGLMALAGIIYTIWDMLNDVIIGHFSDRNFKFTARRGKRFPWILSSIVPLLVIVVLLFSPPSMENDVLILIWFLVFLSLYDGLTSAISVNYQALIPVKYRTKDERRSIGAFIHLFSMLGPFFGLLLLSVLLTSNSIEAYRGLAISLSSLLLLSFLISIPGLRESEELRSSYLKQEETSGSFISEFSSNIKLALKESEFIILGIVFVAITITTSLIAISTPYYVQYVYGADKADLGELQAQVSAPFVVTTVVGIPLYIWIVKKLGHRRAFQIALLSSFLPLLIIFGSLLSSEKGSLLFVMLGAALWGIVGGVLQIARIPLMGDFFDKSALMLRKRREGIYLGLWNFFTRIVTFVMLATLSIIHDITGFDATLSKQSDIAKWGIMSHFGLVPAIFMLLSALLFVRWWKLDEEKMISIKTQLEELGI